MKFIISPFLLYTLSLFSYMFVGSIEEFTVSRLSGKSLTLPNLLHFLRDTDKGDSQRQDTELG